MRLPGTTMLVVLLFHVLTSYADQPVYKYPHGSVEKRAELRVNLPIAVYFGTYTSEAEQSCMFTIKFDSDADRKKPPGRQSLSAGYQPSTKTRQ